MNDIEKAERSQAWKAFLIPASLFVACLFNAAGIYILYAGNSIGMVFLGLGIAVIMVGMFMAITFHNKKRAKGQWKKLSPDTIEAADPLSDFSEDDREAGEPYVLAAPVREPVNHR